MKTEKKQADYDFCHCISAFTYLPLIGLTDTIIPMKKLCIFLLGIMVCIPASAQLLKDLDHVSKFNEGHAAIKKDDSWAFINKKGDIVIDFRDDLVATEQKESEFNAPVFSNGRALIKRTEDKITYFGFIDQKGKKVIQSEYVNATPFKNGFALVMHYNKEVVGQNKLLGKDVVSYEIAEYVIDVNGKALTPMLNARNFVPEKFKSGKSPSFTAKFIGERLVAVYTEGNKWEVYSF